jgi:protein farnesyltransferase/geranylgeranyltransferase type-1 subunit alpha
LKALQIDLNLELDYMDRFAEENPKNYQIWHHRRAIVELLGVGNRELGFCNRIFETDAKNYHAWAHRYIE